MEEQDPLFNKNIILIHWSIYAQKRLANIGICGLIYSCYSRLSRIPLQLTPIRSYSSLFMGKQGRTGYAKCIAIFSYNFLASSSLATIFWVIQQHHNPRPNDSSLTLLVMLNKHPTVILRKELAPLSLIEVLELL